MEKWWKIIKDVIKMKDVRMESTQLIQNIKI